MQWEQLKLYFKTNYNLCCLALIREACSQLCITEITLMTRKKITPVLQCQMGSAPLVLTFLKIQYSTKIQDPGLWQEPSHHSSVLQRVRCWWLLFTESPAQFHIFLPFQSIVPSTSCPGHSETPLCTHRHQPYTAPVPKVPTVSGQQYTQTELQFHLKAEWLKGKAKTLIASPACTQPLSLKQEYRSWRYKLNAQ